MATDFDAVVIGSGAGGGMAAWTLAARGWKVALLEKGRNPWPRLDSPTPSGSLLSNDEIKGERFYGYHDPFIEPRTFSAGDGGEVTTGAVQGLGVALGGGTVFYDADCPRITDVDTRLLTTFGAVEGADVVDWPIHYADLAPYLDETERLIGVQGQAGADPFAEARGAYPMPPGYPPKAGMMLARAARSLGLHPHPMPMGINSTFYRGRPACTNCGYCHFGCPVDAKASTAVTVIRDALQTGNVTVLAECCVVGIDTEPSGAHATGVRYLDAEGAPQTLTARHVVVATNAIETPRLLLASTSAAHPDGLGNGSGLVGRYLMFHVNFEAIGVFPFDVRSYRGRIVTHALADFTVKPDGADAGWVRGGYVELGGQIRPVAEAKRVPWRLAKALMVDGGYMYRIASVAMMGEDMPQRSNRVELDPKVRDVYGRPVARVVYARHAHDQAVVDRYMPKLEEIARAAGATEVMPIDDGATGIPDTKHLLGTCRMGTDAAASVTDAWGRLHEVDNVWIADGSTWPTSTAFNPTLTQMALAYRTAAYMASPEDPRP